jgi:hypothetical protein
MGYEPNKEAQVSLMEAQGLINRAKRAYALNHKAKAESLWRESLIKLRESHLWEPHEHSHRQKLHEVGKKVHDTFGCQLEFRDGSYRVSCPVYLSHSQIGFSIGGTAQVACSICGQDNLTCPHVKGRKYNGVVANKWLEFCSICLRKDCDHAVGEIHDGVEACGIVTMIDLDHVALVKNPANPLCVIESYSLPESDLLDLLPKEGRESFAYGETAVDCHHCTVCEG